MTLNKRTLLSRVSNVYMSCQRSPPPFMSTMPSPPPPLPLHDSLAIEGRLLTIAKCLSLILLSFLPSPTPHPPSPISVKVMQSIGNPHFILRNPSASEKRNLRRPQLRPASSSPYQLPFLFTLLFPW